MSECIGVSFLLSFHFHQFFIKSNSKQLKKKGGGNEVCCGKQKDRDTNK